MSKTLNFGLLFFPRFQWLDAVGTVDYINNHDQSAASLIPSMTPDILEKAPQIKWHYISNNLDPVQTTAGPPLTPDHTYETCPPLDFLVVPGPVPLIELPDGCAAFLQKLIVDDNFKAILTICVASLAVAQSGILDGRRVCSNKVVLRQQALAGTLNPNVKWVGDRRWVVDGKIWSSAGITAGIDLAAEFVRVHFDPALVALAEQAAEYDPNPDQPDKFAFILDGVPLN